MNSIEYISNEIFTISHSAFYTMQDPVRRAFLKFRTIMNRVDRAQFFTLLVNRLDAKMTDDELEATIGALIVAGCDFNVKVSNSALMIICPHPNPSDEAQKRPLIKFICNYSAFSCIDETNDVTSVQENRQEFLHFVKLLQAFADLLIARLTKTTPGELCLSNDLTENLDPLNCVWDNETKKYTFKGNAVSEWEELYFGGIVYPTSRVVDNPFSVRLRIQKTGLIANFPPVEGNMTVFNLEDSFIDSFLKRDFRTITPKEFLIPESAAVDISRISIEIEEVFIERINKRKYSQRSDMSDDDDEYEDDCPIRSAYGRRFSKDEQYERERYGAKF